jgi:Holliday junction resolvasome RuvABC endonuclease subunit
MRIASVDPGAKSCAWALIEPLDPLCQRVRFLERRDADSDFASTRAALAALAPDLVAIERPSGILFGGRRADGLIDCAYVAGSIACVASGIADATRIEMSAQVWRARLIGRPRHRGQFAGGAGDAEVKRILALLVDGLPERSSADVRDAIGLGIVAGRMVAAGMKTAGGTT